MPLKTWISNLWRMAFRKSLVERELDEELNTFLEELVERQVRTGISPENAREEVIVKVGDLDKIRDRILKERRAPLRTAMAFALVGLVCFAVGAGMTAAVWWDDPARLESFLQPSPRTAEPVLPGLRALVSIDDPDGSSRLLARTPPEFTARTFSVSIVPFFEDMALDPDTGLPLQDARVFRRDGSSRASRDRQGRYSMDLRVGWSYTLVIDTESRFLTGFGARRLWPVTLEALQ